VLLIVKGALDAHATQQTARAADSHRVASTKRLVFLKNELTNARFASDAARNAVGLLYEAVANGEKIRKDRVGFPDL